MLTVVMFNTLRCFQNLWKLREHIAEALMHDGYCYKYDVSLPLDFFYKMVEALRERVKSLATRVVGYGHVGDGSCFHSPYSCEFDFTQEWHHLSRSEGHNSFLQGICTST